MKTDTILFIASTPLHLFDALLIAQSSQEKNHHLCYVDRQDEDDLYFTTLDAWEHNPFSAMDIFVTSRRSTIQKIRSKRATIAALIALIERERPVRIVVGNDRKTEMAAVIHSFKGHIPFDYMDDGLHSYMEEKSSFYKYGFFDAWMKRVVYGYPMSVPKVIGSSNSIENLYLYAPELRHQALQRKPAYPLDTHYLHTVEAKHWYRAILSALGMDIEKELEGIKSILFLPHPKALDQAKYGKLQEKLKGRRDIAIKLHPRDTISYRYFPSQKILSSDLSAEILFLLAPSLGIYSFASTTLLMAKWLRPSLCVYSIQFDYGEETPMEALLKKNDIRVLSIESIDF